MKLTHADCIRNQTSDSNFPCTSFQLSAFMNLLTAYRTAKKSAVETCDQTKNGKKGESEREKKESAPIFRRIQRGYITRTGNCTRVALQHLRPLQARHVADFRAGELACEYKTPCIGMQRVAKKGWVVGERGWWSCMRARGEGGKGRETGFESACQNHFSWSAEAVEAAVVAAAASASPPLVRRIQASIANRDAAYRVPAPE